MQNEERTHAFDQNIVDALDYGGVGVVTRLDGLSGVAGAGRGWYLRELGPHRGQGRSREGLLGTRLDIDAVRHGNILIQHQRYGPVMTTSFQRTERSSQLYHSVTCR
jgi:hypothetical protein